MTTPPPPTLAGPDRHALDLDVHVHLPISLARDYIASENGQAMAAAAVTTADGDRDRARSMLLRVALSAIMRSDTYMALGMLDGLALMLRDDIITLLREETP